MRTNRLLNLIAIFVLAFLSACTAQTPTSTPTQAPASPTAQPSSQPAPTPTRPPLPPTVVSIKPDRGEEQVLAAPVLVTFDQQMDPASTSSAFSIEPKVAGEVKVQGNLLTFSPTERLKRGAEYRVIVADSATSTAGLKLQRPVSFKFATAGFLEVTTTQPADNAGEVAVDNAIIVSFNRPVVPLTGVADQATLPQPLVITPTLAGKGEWINTSIYRFTPNLGLAASTAYSVTVKAGLEDTTGGLLPQPYTFGFRTADPTVLRWLPEGGINVKIERPISVTFSMPMDRPSTESAFALLDEAGAPVAGAFNWNRNATELGFKPTRVLKFNTAYTASLAVTAHAAGPTSAGTLREANLRFPFRTVALPKITATSPRQNAGNVAPYKGVQINFASPMDPATFISGTITILPKPTEVYTYYSDNEAMLMLDFAKLPATAYTVTLSGKLANPYGNTLGQDFSLRFRTGDLETSAMLNGAGQIGTYSAYTRTQAVVFYRNAPELKFELYRLSSADFVALNGRESWQAWDRFSPQQDALVRAWTVATSAPRNQSGVVRTDLLDADEQPLPAGMYFLRLANAPTQSQASQSNPRQIIVLTDVNVTLKASNRAALAWVTDLKTGQPVPNAKVRFTDNGKIEALATTGADGVARVDLPAEHKSWEPLLALASTEAGSFGVASATWQQGINAWDFGLTGGNDAIPYTGYVYTDRPIYRPGQTLYWKALIRRDNDAQYTLPAPGQPVTVTINDDQGNVLVQRRTALNAIGAVDGELALGPDAGLGYYYISVRLSEEIGFGVGFQVAEYRKPEYELSAQTDKPEYSQGEQISVTLQANYFFGGPVKNGKVKWVLLSTDSYFTYQGKGYYSFEDFDWYETQRVGPFGGQISQGEGVTDAEGRLTFVVPADITQFKRSQRFNFDITVQDVNNQAVSTQASAVVHKGDFYIGLKPRAYVATVDKPSQIDVITVDPQSQPVPDVPVTLVVNRVEWRSVRERAADGNYYWTTQAKKTAVLTETLTTDATGAALLEWTPDAPGEYKIDASARDSRGHALRSAAYVWVSGSAYVPWRQENNDRIELVADKTEYAAGDTAEILIPSPYQGKVKALVTIERGTVLSHQVIELAGNSEVLKLPIKPEYAPNAFVSVVIMKGIDATSPAPSFKVGLVQLKVSVADKQLQVIVTPRGAAGAGPVKVAPRDTVTWDVQTLDAAGKPVQADVSLALVDKAVLSLATDNAGALMDRFYSQRGLGVQTGITLVYNIDRLVAQLAEGGKGGGGGGGEGLAPTVRRDFPDIAYWTASLKTGADGKAQVQVTLPDNLTTWTMDARAATEDTRVGQSRTDIIATQALLVRPVLPRFFVAGDRAEIAAVIQNTTPQELSVAVTLAPTGLETTAPLASQITVPAESTAKIAWPVTVQAAVDQVKVQMQAIAVAAKLSDAVEITLPVHRYTTPEVTGTSGQVDLNEDRLELVRLPANADPSRGELAVTLEPSLAAGMLGGLTYLEHYPYECVEQTMSRFLPNVVSYAALKKLGGANPDLETRLPQQVGVGLQRIYAKQHIDGGWGWWQNDDSNIAVSAYIVFGLAKAKQAGFAVDQTVLDRGAQFLTRNLRAPGDLKDWQLNSQAFVLYALAEAGQMEPNRAGALFEVRERLSTYAQGYLALTFELIDDEAAAARIKTLLADITGKAVVSATAAHWEEGWTDFWNMNTDTRTTSIALAALARLDPQNSLGPNTVRWLMSARTADRWETTQENAWAIMALTDWMAATGELAGNYTWTVTLNGESLGAGSVTPATVKDAATLRADIGQLLLDQTNGLVISRTAAGDQTGKGQLYYTAHLKSYLPVEEVGSLSRGVSVNREYRLADCVTALQQAANQAGKTRFDETACPAITQAKVGDVIRVKLTVVVPSNLHYVILEDPLPAGAEAIDTGLRTTSSTAQGPEMKQDQPSPWYDWAWTPTHVELRDEKTVMFASELTPGTYQFTYQIRASLPGVFLTLPATAYQMYFPEVWGRGAGSVFTVTE